MFKVLNPHLNVQKFPRHACNYESSQNPSTEKKSTKIVHIDEDMPEESPSSHSPTPVNLVSAEFLHFPWIRTRSKKEKSIQTTIRPIIQTDHPRNVVEVDKPISDSPLFTLASVSVKLLKDDALETVSTPTQGMSLEGKIPSINLETPY